MTQFYPLAGGLTSEISSVDCNDSGALFVEDQVHTTLSEITEKPIMEELKQFVPLESNARSAMDKPKTVLLAVQITFFDCGGIAIGVQISHKIADGTSLVTFLNSWAASCRGDDEHMLPRAFEWAKLFPPIDMSCFGFKLPTTKTKEKIVTERFVFDKEKLAKLKQAAASTPRSKGNYPTRVEAVSAFIWSNFRTASNSKKMVTASPTSSH